ncbi:MAG: PhzF family phenazine biosynthesis protein [Oleiphilaceae bacterium]|nr:PhzF family phenazine biosynthesis protein [Oleiphilus sp. HI0125]KZZ57532.1 isomerase [Oleiphilus sp. HI0125]MCH2158031.1 PhzF family phenazine biosynthesis protein [Oleiphilaceae bacterium]
MELNLFQVDAFATELFEGNPAAVCPLQSWLPDDLLQKIAQENNLSETAFFVETQNFFRLRWFTPEHEVDLCGHATLAASHVLFKHLGYSGKAIRFQTRSGILVVERTDSGYGMNFPAAVLTETTNHDILSEALGIEPKAAWSASDYIAVLDNEAEVLAVSPDFLKLSELDLRGVIVTAPGDEFDFVSRCFFPKLGVNEDPVTGSAHCELAPYWGNRLGKSHLTAKQLSKRTGIVECEVDGNRVVLTGNVVDYLKGVIKIDV